MFAGVGSLVPDETLALFVTAGTALSAGETVSVIVELLPFARSPGFEQVTFCPIAEQLQPVPVPETKLKPVGSVSVTAIGPEAVEGPLLVTVMVYTPLVPTRKSPLWVLVICRSALAPTLVGSLAESFELFGSVVGEETVTPFVTAGIADELTATVSVIAADEPFVKSDARVQVTVCPMAEQLQPVPVPETKLKPVGSKSTTVIGPAAVDGPLFVTVMV